MKSGKPGDAGPGRERIRGQCNKEHVCEVGRESLMPLQGTEGQEEPGRERLLSSTRPRDPLRYLSVWVAEDNGLGSQPGREHWVVTELSKAKDTTMEHRQRHIHQSGRRAHLKYAHRGAGRVGECAPHSQDKYGPQEGREVAGVTQVVECTSRPCLSSGIL